MNVMTNRETLLALADRVEALSGPCRETDAAIHAALAAIADWEGFPDWIVPDNSPPYTGSIDSAMSLYLDVPERVPSNPRAATAEALRQRADRND